MCITLVYDALKMEYTVYHFVKISIVIHKTVYHAPWNVYHTPIFIKFPIYIQLFSCYINLRWTNCSKNISNRKFVADQYAINKWLGRKYCPPPAMVEDFFYKGWIYMKKTGFYIIKDSFFEDMDEPYLKGNKEGNRPHYYCFEDSVSGLYWMIPLSSRIDK